MKQNSSGKKQVVIGITGGIGSGKTTVTEYLSKMGFPIVDADRISRNLMDEEDIAGEVVDTFGKGILDAYGNVDRRKLREMVFRDKNLLKKLNSIFHPKIRERIEKNIVDLKKEGNKIIFLDAPLLIENNLDRMVDEVWIVSCSIETQIDRVMKRDDSKRKEIEQIIKKQMPLEEKLKHADIVFQNEDSITDLKDKIEYALKDLINRI
ncbi:MAG TPA: dephospho-CoA kinase [Clostridia bacterium]|nr:dephospho-CoA kinase [Clostridia bacterium]